MFTFLQQNGMEISVRKVLEEIPYLIKSARDANDAAINRNNANRVGRAGTQARFMIDPTCFNGKLDVNTIQKIFYT